jgi:hypothetical protein
MSDETVNVRSIVDDVDRAVVDVEAEVRRLSAEGAAFRNEIIDGPGGPHALVLDPSGKYVQPFPPSGRP